MSRPRPSLWGGTTSTWRNATINSAVGGEIDLRAEFDLIVFGDSEHVSHGKWVLVRRMRRNADGNPTYCTCMDIATQTTVEPDPDCSYCLGEGYLWDEEWKKCYSMYGGADSGFMRRQVWMPPGSIRVDYKIFFFRYDTELKYGDKIVEVRLDAEGDIELPYVREAIYKPQTINPYRSDNGRIEYYAVYCREEDAIRTDNPQS